MSGADKTIRNGLIVIIGDNSQPKRKIAYDYLVKAQDYATMRYVIDPGESFEGFWRDATTIDEKFVFDRWHDAIGETIERLKKMDRQCILIMHHYIDTHSSVFDRLLTSLKNPGLLLIVTILDRGQTFPQNIIDVADHIIHCK